MNKKTKPIIELKDVDVVLGKKLVLQNINLDIFKGEYIGLIGRNGSGKTTLMKTILGLYEPVRGTVKVFGKNISSKTYDYIGYMPQMKRIPHAFPATVKDVVGMGLYKERLFNPFIESPFKKIRNKLWDFLPQHSLMKKMIKEPNRSESNNDYTDRIMYALHKVNMEKYVNRPIGHLSGGEQQKVLVAQALVREPEILLLDEPTSSLDFVMVKDFLKLLTNLNSEYGITLMVIQHNLEMLQPFCNRLIMLRGTIMYDGPPNIPKASEMIQKVF